MRLRNEDETPGPSLPRRRFRIFSGASRLFRMPSLALVLALGWGLVLLLRLIVTRSFNSDELSHAHMAWLVSVGEVPYRDFAANHFPFLWYLLTPLMGVLPQSPAGMDLLRLISLVLNVAFLGALSALVSSGLPKEDRIWAVAAFAITALSPQATHFLMEFRPDPFANALLFCSLAWIAVRPGRSFLIWAVCGCCVAGAMLINTKYLAFPIVLGLVVLAGRRGKFGQSWPYGFSFAAGLGGGLLCGVLLMVWMRVSLESAWLWVVKYNGEVERARTFGYGLARALGGEPVWLAYVVAGIAGCTILLLLRRRRPEAYMVAAVIVLAVGLVATTRPWKQYVASWLLLGSLFPAWLLPRLATRLGYRSQCGLALGVAAVLVLETFSAGARDPNGNRLDRATQDRVMRWALAQVPPGGYVVAGFPLHPVFRRDSFFKVVIDVTGRGTDGLEELMPGLVPAALKERLLPAGYFRDLEARPPGFIEAGRFYTPAQTEALNAWLQNEGTNYHSVQVPETQLNALVRKGNLEPQAGNSR